MSPGPGGRAVDLNADLGEGYGPWRVGDDLALLEVVSSANVACGFHAGDPSIMRATCRAAAGRGVRIGAHVAYPDLAGFGRRAMALAPREIADAVTYQLGALRACARGAGAQVTYVKPHGALYHRGARDAETAEAIAQAVARVDPGLAVLGPPGSALERASAAAGLRARAEGFADRAYDDEGRLVARADPGGTLDAPAAARQAVELALRGRARAVSGRWIPVRADSICVHGDAPGAAEVARAVRAGLADAGVDVRA